MTTEMETNKSLVRAYYEEVLNRRRPERALTLFSSSFREANREHLQGAEGVREHARAFLEAFPDAQFELEEVVAEKDRVAVRIRMSGTHRGTLMTLWGEIPPSGRKITVRYMDFYRCKDGRIVESHALMNQVEQLRELGLKIKVEAL